MMKFLKENWVSLLTILFLVVVGVLLLVDPALYSMIILQVGGGLLTAMGIYDIVKYFRAEPEEAAKGSGFYSGSIMISGGALCIFGGKWFVDVFPVLAVLFGIFEILLGFRKLQRMVDSLRMKKPLWWLKAIGAAVSILFGFIITLNPQMKMMGIWVFTGITMIVEGLFDAAALFVQMKESRGKTPFAVLNIRRDRKNLEEASREGAPEEAPAPVSEAAEAPGPAEAPKPAEAPEPAEPADAAGAPEKSE